MSAYCSNTQKGVVIPLVTIMLPVLLLTTGWALDYGHTFVSKTRLQNALDAAALSAAVTINRDNSNTSAATAAGIATFTAFKTSAGNNELSTLAAPTFEYSNTYSPFTPGSTPAAFVRVSSNTLSVTPILTRVIAALSSNISVPAKATAGPVGNTCSPVMPFLLCADGGLTPDKNCSDGACYGYNVNQIYNLVAAGCQGNGKSQVCNLSAGNYGLLNLPGQNGGNDIKLALQGKAVNVCPLGGNLPLDSKPGLTNGPVQDGINYRIDTLDNNHLDYPNTPETNSPDYSQYVQNTSSNYSRVMPIPLGNCANMKDGAATLPLVGMGCIFINQHTSGNGQNLKVNVQFIGSCTQKGVLDPTDASIGLGKLVNIILLKTPGGGDS